MNDTNDLLFPWRILICDSKGDLSPETSGRLAHELSRWDGHPVSDGGGLLYGFHSRWRRDQVLDSLRQRYGLTCVSPVGQYAEVP